MNEQTVQKIRQVFNKFKPNDRGQIQISDLANYPQYMQSIFQELGIDLKPEYFQNMIHDMDNNGDGVVSFLFETN